MHELIDAKNNTISEKISFVSGVSVSSMSENDQLSRVDTSSYTRFLETFPLQGNALFTGLFERHGDVIQTQKAKFAVANLER